KNPADSSEGLINADNLLQDIQRERLHIETEKVNVPGQPFRVLVTYRNLARFHFRIIKVSPGQLDSLVSITYNENYWKKLIQLNSSKTNIQDLPDTKDFQEHKVEIKISALEPGSYIMLASGGVDFKMEGNPMAAQIFYVSNLSFVQNDQDFFVLNRETGQPVQGVTVQVWYKYYDANLRKQASRRGEQFNTDKNGYFHLSPSKTKSNNTYRLELTSENDHLLMNDQFDYYRYDRTEYSNATKEDQKSYEADNLKGFFFLDRSIYRPGQTIYFKGIVVTRDFNTKQFKILSSFKTRVFLFDADGQPLDSMDITTNDFGSYHGKFILPVSRLTGEFNI
ncbi:MAG TPA: MG2 domain-containing protein, partial [Puia sp.]|nr:MG2 domain-containing protein [Puia sp.]